MILKDTFDSIIAANSEKYGVPFTWIKAIIGAESDFNPLAFRAEPRINDASRGLMQVLMKTAQGLGFTGTADDLFDPFINIDLGAKLLAENIRRFGQDFNRVYSAYNSGSPSAWETNTEVRAHLSRALAYLAEVEKSVTQVQPASTSGKASTIGIILAAALAIYLLWRL